MRTSSTLLTRSWTDFIETVMTKNVSVCSKSVSVFHRSFLYGTRWALSPFTPDHPTSRTPASCCWFLHRSRVRTSARTTGTANHNDWLNYSRSHRRTVEAFEGLGLTLEGRDLANERREKHKASARRSGLNPVGFNSDKIVKYHKT